MLTPTVAIVDYGLGNLFSVKHVCEHVGLTVRITCCKHEILGAAAVILPGVGAFGDAMDSLRRHDLVSPLRDIAQSETPLIGICLGLQLLMSESFEFGNHQGLGIVEGAVVRFCRPRTNLKELKVPQIGWNRIFPPGDQATISQGNLWAGTLLSETRLGEYMYFVHSFHAQVARPEIVQSLSRYGNIDFCSSIEHKNITAFQFHPERSGPAGISIYRNLAARIQSRGQTKEVRHAA